MHRTFDRVAEFDIRSRAFPIRAVAAGTPRNVTYRTPDPLDQGAEGACVGFGWTHEALTTPVAVDLGRIKAVAPRDPTAFARNVYFMAQLNDEWPGENYEGTSVNSGAKMMRDLGLLKEWRWCFSLYDVALALWSTGPVVLGINWHSSMYTAPGGVVTVDGPVVGGHCILCVGYRKAGVIFPDDDAFRLFNSWGSGWGDNGKAWIRGKDLTALMMAGGEACVPFRRSYGR